MTLVNRITWLKVASASVIGFGLLITVSLVFGFNNIWIHFFNLVFINDCILMVSSEPDALLTSAILGGVFTAWGVMLWQITSKLMPENPELGRSLILWSVGCWFVLDSLASLAVGAPLNVLYNAGYLLLFVVPLWQPIKPVSSSATEA